MSKANKKSAHRKDHHHQAGPSKKMKRKEYEREMRILQGELVAMQEWVKATGARVCIVFEGVDRAGKGARSVGSPNERALGCSSISPCPHQMRASSRRCTFNATWRTSRRVGRS